MKKWKKYIFLMHRYLGMFLAPFIFLWSFSAIVMMYVSYPKLHESERIALLPAIGEFDCCDQRAMAAFTPLLLAEFSLENLNGNIVAKIRTVENKRGVFQLSNNSWLRGLNENTVLEIAKKSYGKEIIGLEEIERDQWTVYSKYNIHRPLFKIMLNDEDNTEVYISSENGEIVQQTTSFQRNWSWIGAVTHWLYPTALRKHTKIWYWLVVGLSILSLLALISGIWLGIKQLKKRKNKPISPYQGMRLLHHWGGVIISFFLFTFLLSGLLSMNPWGILESRSYSMKKALGKEVKTDQILSSLESFSTKKLAINPVQIKMVSWDNDVYWIATDRAGVRTRYNQYFEQQAITQKELEQVGIALGGRQVEQGVLAQEDLYYFSHKNAIELPVWKISANHEQGEEVLFYLSPLTGEMIKSVDKNRRLYRWLFNALHRWDFSQLSRQRPIWDVMLIPVLVLLTLFGFSGCYLGWKRLKP